MAGIIRFFFGLILSTLAARIVDGVLAKALDKTPKDEPKTAIPTLDLKACPTCGVFTTQPCPHCAARNQV